MNLLTAIIQPEMLGEVRSVLQPQEACLVSVSQATVFHTDPACQIVYRGATKQVRPTRLRVEIIVEDDCVDEVIDAIAESGATGGGEQLTDGANFVLPLTDCVGIGRSRQRPLAASVS